MIELVYFFVFQAVGVGMAFMPAHLRALGFSGPRISVALAAAPLMSLAVPLLWAWVADRTQRHDRVLRVVTLGAWLGFSPLVLAPGDASRSFAVVLTGYVCYALFYVGIGGMTDALAVARVRAGAIYGRLRGWGSVGFICSAMAVGLLIQATHADPAGRLVPAAMWFGLGGAFLAALRIGGTGERAVRPRFAEVRALLRQPGLRLLLLAGGLHWMCMAPYNIFLGIFLRDLGLRPLFWGLAYAVGVVAETVALLSFHRLHRRFALGQLLAAAFAASAVRWLGTSVARTPTALILLQLFHGMTFGLFWSAAIELVATLVPPPLRATGNALLVMAINAGGAIGNLGTGALYDALGPRAPFLLAAAGEILPLALVLRARGTGLMKSRRAGTH
ncbi:MAG TPA: MFS transporter [Polyangia bacterium]|nr:MFS transporter [Polyangia bacterium]